MSGEQTPVAICGGCGQTSFGGKFPELSVEYDGEENSTRLCEGCVGSPYDVIKAIQSNGGISNGEEQRGGSR